MPKSQCAALDAAVSELQRDPEYRNLKWTQLKNIVEGRAATRLGIQWDQLTQLEKLREMQAARALRYQGMTNALMLELQTAATRAGIQEPLGYLLTNPAGAERLRRGARDSARTRERERLVDERRRLTTRIRELGTRRPRLPSNGTGARKRNLKVTGPDRHRKGVPRRTKAS